MWNVLIANFKYFFCTLQMFFHSSNFYEKENQRLINFETARWTNMFLCISSFPLVVIISRWDFAQTVGSKIAVGYTCPSILPSEHASCSGLVICWSIDWYHSLIAVTSTRPMRYYIVVEYWERCYAERLSVRRKKRLRFDRTRWNYEITSEKLRSVVRYWSEGTIAFRMPIRWEFYSHMYMRQPKVK